MCYVLYEGFVAFQNILIYKFFFVAQPDLATIVAPSVMAVCLFFLGLAALICLIIWRICPKGKTLQKTPQYIYS